MKICARCDLRILPGDEKPVDNAAPTGAGTTVYIHKHLCRKTPTQTSPRPWSRES
ncbi:hypothetical protein M2271_006590 [Streptomyces sp. LBL]|uniref:hypothetical protein n=1 Tax=Streptomyces sp. LBL TaxID=2940562 RepID=UPI002474C464|nr:hypothetical protein [Streptomyces sp. LBL]MDH6628757.1 hypothetical protein [Streptomyces sp. LBL]